MADIFIIHGGKPLQGEIAIRGSKNATLPIFAASMLNRGSTRLENAAMIQDVFKLGEILNAWGAKTQINSHTITINAGACASVFSNTQADALVRKLRGSVLCIGAMLARFGEIRIPLPGGDTIGARPLDVLFDGLRALGACIEQNKDVLDICAPQGLHAAKIVLKETSVTATEALMMASAGAEGTTIIKLAATEPHVQDLGAFLQKLGVRIEGLGTSTIIIHGIDASAIRMDVTHAIISDSDEAVNIAVLCAATRSEVQISNINPDFIDAGILQLQLMGANIEFGDTWTRVHKPADIYRAAKIQCGLYPKLMSDQVPPFALLATQAQGVSMIQEWMYEGRLGYVNEIIKMGANAIIMDPHRALIVGPTVLRGAELKSLDIRAGITMIIAGLVAQGETTILDAHIIDRGFEQIEQRLQQIGADIVRKQV